MNLERLKIAKNIHGKTIQSIQIKEFEFDFNNITIVFSGGTKLLIEAGREDVLHIRLALN